MAIKPIFNNLLNKGVIKELPFNENAKFNLPESETKTFYTEVLNKLDFEDETNLYTNRFRGKRGVIANG